MTTKREQLRDKLFRYLNMETEYEDRQRSYRWADNILSILEQEKALKDEYLMESKCTFCGSTEDVIIVPVNTLYNLQPVCLACWEEFMDVCRADNK